MTCWHNASDIYRLSQDVRALHADVRRLSEAVEKIARILVPRATAVVIDEPPPTPSGPDEFTVIRDITDDATTT